MCDEYDYLQQVSMMMKDHLRWTRHTQTRARTRTCHVFTCKQMQLPMYQCAYSTHRSSHAHIFSACQISFTRWPDRENTFHGSDWLITLCFYVFICLSLEISHYCVAKWQSADLHCDVTMLLEVCSDRFIAMAANE